jgi:site-specific DNA-methyltransferase (adenine-specific)
MEYRVKLGDCMDVIYEDGLTYDCIFADPPDNIGLKYNGYKDTMSPVQYEEALWRWVRTFIDYAPTVWMSFNARWTMAMGRLCHQLQIEQPGLKVKPCVQTFTFGQHNHNDLGNCHRPLWRITQPGAKIYPNQVRVPSWRQQNGDKRADPRGRVPGDVFDVPRVTGNSKQRRRWHPTQLHEELIERCVKLSTVEGGRVLDPFGGTGTTLRVCKKINRSCTVIEVDPEYCRRIMEENGL